MSVVVARAIFVRTPEFVHTFVETDSMLLFLMILTEFL